MHLDEKDVHVWRIDASLFENASEWRECVSPEDLSKTKRFKFSSLADQWLIFRAALRCILSGYLSMPPKEIQFVIDEYGKPHISGSGIRFNISHSQYKGVVAVCRNVLVGIDCEVRKEDIDIDALVQDVFSEQEQIQFSQIPEPDNRMDAFYRCWTRKEAIVKAIGKGLYIPLSSFSVSISADNPVSILQGDGELFNLSEWTLEDISGEEVHAALAVKQRPVSIHYKKFQKFPSV